MEIVNDPFNWQKAKTTTLEVWWKVQKAKGKEQ